MNKIPVVIGCKKKSLKAISENSDEHKNDASPGGSYKSNSLNREKHDIYENSDAFDKEKQEEGKDEKWNFCIEIAEDKNLNEESDQDIENLSVEAQSYS